MWYIVINLNLIKFNCCCKWVILIVNCSILYINILCLIYGKINKTPRTFNIKNNDNKNNNNNNNNNDNDNDDEDDEFHHFANSHCPLLSALTSLLDAENFVGSSICSLPIKYKLQFGYISLNLIILIQTQIIYTNRYLSLYTYIYIEWYYSMNDFLNVVHTMVSFNSSFILR